jgi:uncharacterized protein (TIGR03435 family)
MSARMSGQPLPAGGAIFVKGLRVVGENVTMKQMIVRAYEIDSRLILGPAWVMEGEVLFTMHAGMPQGSTEKQLPEMMRSLLAERFHLATHREPVEQPGYALVVAKNGPKLKHPTDIDPSVCEEWEGALGGYQICREEQETDHGRISTRIMRNSAQGPLLSSISGKEWHDEYYRMTMAKLAQLVEGSISSGGSWASARGPTGALTPVVDRTGIEGEWHVVLDTDVSDPGVRFATLQSSLERQGLRLEKITVPMEKLVIDSIDRIPTEN